MLADSCLRNERRSMARTPLVDLFRLASTRKDGVRQTRQYNFNRRLFSDSWVYFQFFVTVNFFNSTIFLLTTNLYHLFFFFRCFNMECNKLKCNVETKSNSEYNNSIQIGFKQIQRWNYWLNYCRMYYSVRVLKYNIDDGKSNWSDGELEVIN